jgi:hypothetical protein
MPVTIEHDVTSDKYPRIFVTGYSGLHEMVDITGISLVVRIITQALRAIISKVTGPAVQP